MLCTKCGSLDHWEKGCTKVQQVDSEIIKTGPIVQVGCQECADKDLEISRLRAKYEYTAEERLERILQQNREAQKRYRQKQRLGRRRTGK